MSELSPYLTKFYGGESSKKGFYIILEDISDQFKMRDIAKGLNMDEILEALKALALFHGISYAYGIKNQVDYGQMFPVIYPKFLEDQSLTESAERGLKLFVEDLKKNATAELLEKGQKFQINYRHIFGKYLKASDTRFLAHGDYWGNNVMYGENGKIF